MREVGVGVAGVVGEVALEWESHCWQSLKVDQRFGSDQSVQ